MPAAADARAMAWEEQTSVLGRLAAAAQAEDPAGRICRELAGLAGIDRAILLGTDAAGRHVALGVSDPTDPAIAVNRPLAEPLEARLRPRLDAGPWVGPWDLAPGSPPPRAGGAESGSMAVVPFRIGPRAVGALLLEAAGEQVRWLVEHLPAFEAAAAVIASVMAAELVTRRDRAMVDAEIAALLASGAFRPVFQPIVALETGLAVGHEALTRFDDGVRPDRRFADAAAVGRGVELELACVEAAIEASQGLPGGPWLSLNVSPAVIQAGTRLRRVLARSPHRVVLEISAHAVGDDRRALRRAIASLGHAVRVALDDASAGATNVRHIVGLRPDFVKVDMGVVHAIERDPVRQAVVAGLAYVTIRNGGTLIAEGIERVEEQDALHDLGVALGQGFLYARPGPAASIALLAGQPDAASFIGLS
jgi:EAL domain-containing protein (putative c-di-GMP-specific phosphodiesterase class I)